MGIIKQTIVKCDGCGAEAKCGSLPPINAIEAMKKRGWFCHYKIGFYCNGCNAEYHQNKEKRNDA